MLLYITDYKGKWHIYDDEPDELFGSVGTVESDELSDMTLIYHAEACDYYGIPMYKGKDKEFRARCDKARAQLDTL